MSFLKNYFDKKYANFLMEPPYYTYLHDKKYIVGVDPIYSRSLLEELLNYNPPVLTKVGMILMEQDYSHDPQTENNLTEYLNKNGIEVINNKFIKPMKYKLKSVYPGSPAMGTVVELESKDATAFRAYGMSPRNPHMIHRNEAGVKIGELPQSEVIGWPEFWEPISEEPKKEFRLSIAVYSSLGASVKTKYFSTEKERDAYVSGYNDCVLK